MLGDGEHLEIRPSEYLHFDDVKNVGGHLIRSDFRLTSRQHSRDFGDHIYLQSLASLRNYLTTAEVDSTHSFRSEENVAVMEFRFEETYLRIEGSLPDDDYFESIYPDSTLRLEKQFATQLRFKCNFPLLKVPAVIGDIEHLLRTLESIRRT